MTLSSDSHHAGEPWQSTLEEWEPLSVGASALLRLPKSEHQFIKLPNGGLVGVRRNKVFFPLRPCSQVQLPTQLRQRLEKGSLTLIGTPDWLSPLEACLPNIWRTVDYWFLALNRQERPYPVPPLGLTIKTAGISDLDRLFSLQEGYEKEEVIFTPDDYHQAASRAAFRKSLQREKHWYLESREGVLSKASTNAQGLGWFQLGGVYTAPLYRRHGYARMVLEFAAAECSQLGVGLCLFVKKSNQTARRLYESLGYQNLGDYRITYSL